MEYITSAQNPLLKHIKRLQSVRSYREQCGEFVCDGWKLLDEALRWYPKLGTLICTKGSDCPELPQGTRVVEIPESLMQSLSAMKAPQGVIFTLQLPQMQTPNIKRGMLLLDRIQDPGNLGTILRTADAFGIEVLLTNGCADAFSEKTVRASMGAVFRTLPQSVEMEQLLQQCKRKGIALAATALTQEAVDLRELDLRNYITVIGSEGQGICDALLQASERQIIIPMQPRCESLNAAIAAAIVMWQMK